MDPVRRRIPGWDGTPIGTHDHVLTLGGCARRVESIDSDGYARLEGEVSTFYVRHLTKLVRHETYAADLTLGPALVHMPITEDVMPAFLAGLSAKAKSMPRFQD